MTAYKAFAAVYDRLMDDMPYDKWLQFSEEIWGRFGKPQHVVDLGCGTGTIALMLAKKGYEITGIDISSSMLQIAAEKQQRLFDAQQAGETPSGQTAASSFYEQGVRWLEQNMCNWKTDKPADSVISFCDCLNYLLDEDELLATFEATYNGLKSGGSFIFDVHPISKFQQYAVEAPFVYDEDGISYLWNSYYDEDEHIIEHQLAIFVAENEGLYRRIDELHVQRAYHPKWIEGALHAAGFGKIYQYADFACKPQDEYAERLFFVAIK